MERPVYTVSLRGDDPAKTMEFFVTGSPYGNLAVYFEEPDCRGIAYAGLYVSHDKKCLQVASVRPEEKNWITNYFMKGYHGKYLAIDWELPGELKTPEEASAEYVLAVAWEAYKNAGDAPVAMHSLRERMPDMSYKYMLKTVSHLYETGKIDAWKTGRTHLVAPIINPAGTAEQMRSAYQKLLLERHGPNSNDMYQMLIEMWATQEPTDTKSMLSRMKKEWPEMPKNYVSAGMNLLVQRGLVINVGNATKAYYAPVKSFLSRKKANRQTHHRP